MELRFSTWLLVFWLVLGGCASTSADQSDTQRAGAAQQEEVLTPASPEDAMEQSRGQQRKETEKTIMMVIGGYVLFWVAVAGVLVACAGGAC